MKSIITFVCAALAAIVFVACSKNMYGSDSPKQSVNKAVSYKYNFTVAVPDDATDHQTVLTTVVSAADETGTVKEYALPDGQKSLTVANTVPIASEIGIDEPVCALILSHIKRHNIEAARF